MYVDVDTQDGIVEVILNHPPVNALPAAGWAHLAEVVGGLGRDQPALGRGRKEEQRFR